MSKRKYPRVGEISPISVYPGYRKYKNCVCCNGSANKLVRVQFDWFRGEDGCYPACSTHIAMANKNVGKFLDAVSRDYQDA